MTELIGKQLFTIGIMFSAGLCAGIMNDVFKTFEEKFSGKITYIILELIKYVVIAYLIGEFNFFGRNGKITFTAIASFFIGLLLWSKYFCGTIAVGENNEQKRQKT